MTTIQLGLLGEDEITTELSTTLIESTEDLKAFFSNVCGKSEEEVAYDNADKAFNEYFPVWSEARNTFYKVHEMADHAKADFVKAKAIYDKLLNDLDVAEAAL